MNEKFKRGLIGAFDSVCHLLHRTSLYEYNTDLVELVADVRDSESNVFRGYYDIDHIDSSGTKLLIHKLKGTEKKEAVTIGYFDFLDRKIIDLAETSAWCWQQGSRLRWFNDNNILFNDYNKGEYVAKVVDLEGTVIRRYSCALYDIDEACTFGLSLNFTRLQRIRPGYGYSNESDKTKGVMDPFDDGIFRLSLITGDCEHIISYERLRAEVAPNVNGEAYINHISISPSGKFFLFFYIIDDGRRSKVFLCVADCFGAKIRVLEREARASHYCWVSDHEVLITYYLNDIQGYMLYDIVSLKKTPYFPRLLFKDGHPSFMTNRFMISDTYPQRKRLNEQELFLFDSEKQKIHEIASVYADFHYAGERRCDLHPSFHDDMVTIDSNCHGKRNVLVFRIKEQL